MYLSSLVDFPFTPSVLLKNDKI